MRHMRQPAPRHIAYVQQRAENQVLHPERFGGVGDVFSLRDFAAGRGGVPVVGYEEDGVGAGEGGEEAGWGGEVGLRGVSI